MDKHITKPRKKPTRKEEALQTAVATYIRAQYPGVVFLSDASGTYMSKRNASIGKMQRSGRGIPDLIVLAGRGGYYGMCLELKAEGVNIVKKDGEWANAHIAEQANVLGYLGNEGYYAHFAVGFDEAKEMIDSYMALGDIANIVKITPNMKQ